MMKRPVKIRYLTLLLVLLLAFGIRVLDLGARALWFDEAVEYLTAQAPLSELPARIIARNYQPPLFTYLLHAWLRISLHPLWLRFLSVGLSMVALATMIRWSYDRIGYRGALLSGLIIALMPTEIYHAQDVGEYALLLLLLTASLYFLDRARIRPTWANWLGWGFLSAAALYTHYGAAIILGPAALVTLAALVWHRQKEAWQRQLSVSAGLAVGMVPVLVYFLPAQLDRGSNGSTWQGYTFPGWESVTSDFVALLHRTFLYNFTGQPLSDVPSLPATALLVLLALTLLLLIRRLSRSWLLSSAIGLALYFALVQVNLYAGGFRYGLIFTPLLVVIVAQALASLWDKQWALALLPLLLLLGVEVYGLPQATLSAWTRRQPSWQPREQMERSFAYWRSQRLPDDVAFVYYGAVPAFRYYLQATGTNEATPASEIVCDAQERYPVCSEYRLFYSPWVRQLSPEEKVIAMYELLGGQPERLWLIFSHIHGEEDKEMLEALAPAYEVVQRSDEEAEGAYLLVRRE